MRLAYADPPYLGCARYYPEHPDAAHSSADGAPVGRDHLRQGITMQRGLTGAKPEQFCRWVLDLLGYLPGDDLDDLFPGTGIMAAVLRQGVLV